ncbi:hypothetical protein WN944_000888 [Citrus x changshan-huyou]|uniref:Uncharacterized protein n=1 Tax=Citrus x changshan-huyou TaxID=2935761 RepID=A0AAP0MIP4_9ROSI
MHFLTLNSVPAFLLSKKKRGKYKNENSIFLCPISPKPNRPTLNREFATSLRIGTSSLCLSTNSHHPSFTDGDAVLTVDRASPSTNRKAQSSLASPSKISSLFSQLLSGSHHATTSATIAGLTLSLHCFVAISAASLQPTATTHESLEEIDLVKHKLRASAVFLPFMGPKCYAIPAWASQCWPVLLHAASQV